MWSTRFCLEELRCSEWNCCQMESLMKKAKMRESVSLLKMTRLVSNIANHLKLGDHKLNCVSNAVKN